MKFDSTITMLPNLFHRVGDVLTKTHSYSYMFSGIYIENRKVYTENCIFCGKRKKDSSLLIENFEEGRDMVFPNINDLQRFTGETSGQ